MSRSGIVTTDSSSSYLDRPADGMSEISWLQFGCMYRSTQNSGREKNKKENLQYEKELEDYEAPILKRRSRSRSNKAEQNLGHTSLLANNAKSPTSKDDCVANYSFNMKSVEKKNVAHCNEFDPENDDFYKLLDKREAKRKLLQKVNEERLSKLLDMKHIFSTTQTNYRTLDRKINERQAALRKTNSQVLDKHYDHQSKRDFKVTTVDHTEIEQESATPIKVDLNNFKAKVIPECIPKTSQQIANPNPMSVIPVPEKMKRRRYSEPNDVKSKSKISKVINFVAITVNESEPKYESKTIKENPVPASRHIDCPRKYEPTKLKRIYYSLPNKKPKIETAEEFTENVREEYIGIIEELEQLRAETGCERNYANKKIFVEIPEVRTLTREVSPVPPLTGRGLSEDDQPRTLQFSSVRTNFVTDTLFAGNIYVGHHVEDKTENDIPNEKRGKILSWRQRFEENSL